VVKLDFTQGHLLPLKLRVKHFSVKKLMKLMELRRYGKISNFKIQECKATCSPSMSLEAGAFHPDSRLVHGDDHLNFQIFRCLYLRKAMPVDTYESSQVSSLHR